MLAKTDAGPQAEDDWPIAVVELLALIVLAAIRAAAWAKERVFYVTDNANVKAWPTKRRPRNAVARHLIRLLERLEAQYDFRVEGLFIRTYHNHVADWLTREEAEKVHRELSARGWKRRENRTTGASW